MITTVVGSYPKIPAQGPADVQVEEVYLAKDNGSGIAGEAATVFMPTDIPLYCVVILSTIEPVQVKMNFVAAAVPGGGAVGRHAVGSAS